MRRRDYLKNKPRPKLDIPEFRLRLHIYDRLINKYTGDTWIVIDAIWLAVTHYDLINDRTTEAITCTRTFIEDNFEATEEYCYEPVAAPEIIGRNSNGGLHVRVGTSHYFIKHGETIHNKEHYISLGHDGRLEYIKQ